MTQLAGRRGEAESFRLYISLTENEILCSSRSGSAIYVGYVLKLDFAVVTVRVRASDTDTGIIHFFFNVKNTDVYK